MRPWLIVSVPENVLLPESTNRPSELPIFVTLPPPEITPLNVMSVVDSFVHDWFAPREIAEAMTWLPAAPELAAMPPPLIVRVLFVRFNAVSALSLKRRPSAVRLPFRLMFVPDPMPL